MLFFLIIGLAAIQCKAQFVEEFNYPDWGKQSIWRGNTESFIVKNNQLQSNGPLSSNSKLYISTPVALGKNAHWQFTVDLKFNPTSSNFIRIYLASNESALDQPLDGYFLQIGQTNEDFIKIFRQSKSDIEELFTSTRSLGQSNIKTTIFIDRDTSSLWKVYTLNESGKEKLFEGSFQDKTYQQSQYFGIYCQYATPSRNNLYGLDDIYLNALPKAARPAVKFKDILITELMPDPSPSVDLPEREYIELYNRSNDTIDLAGFTISDSTSNCRLSRKLIYPKSYLVLCEEKDTSYFSGNVLGCTPLPSLNNSGDHIRLLSPDKSLIDEVRYSIDFYHNNEKSSGGWSLELINLEDPCLLSDNWAASADGKGGTPGAKNSILSNAILPVKLKYSLNENDFSIHCNKAIDTANFKTLDWQCVPQVDFYNFKFDHKENVITCNSNRPLEANSNYRFSLKSIKDCLNQPLNDSLLFINFIIPDSAAPGDIIINEVLFNPTTGGSDFIEIYNKSDKYIDLSKWTFSNNSTTRDYPIQLVTNIISPHGYLAITPDKNALLSHYQQAKKENIVEADLPPLNDDMGVVSLKNNTHQVMDEMSFDEKMHHVLIKNKEGVSLERISPFAPSASQDSWHSASANSGYGTPGYENSQNVNLENQNFSIEPHVFSPNQDGYNDFAVIRYNFGSTGYIGNLNVFDAHGRHIQTLANNSLLSTEGIFQWDGTDKEHRMAIPGQYIVVFSSYHMSGDVKDFKEVVVLGF
ncbi:MAG TPA: lamin tail domain-containing protein [Cytophagaceae bacterium]|jgi:hypothetical protein